MRLVAVLTTLALIAVPSIVVADQSEYTELVDDFFNAIAQGKSAEGVKKIYGTNPWMDRVQDQVANVQTGLSALPGTVGEYHSHELVTKKEIANRLVYLYYFVAFDRQPVRFEFQFYRADKKWMLYSFSFDDTLNDELSERGRIEAVQNTDD